MYTVYVLMDGKRKFYKGMTNNLDRRLKEHQSGKTKTTSKMSNLMVAYREEFDDRDKARKREIYFKTAAGRRFIKNKLGGGA